MSQLPFNIVCRACNKKTQRRMRCLHCDKCPICADKGFLRDDEGVIPYYNCNPDGM